MQLIQKRVRLIFLFLLLPLALFAEPNVDDKLLYCLKALYHGSFTAVACQISASPPELPGVNVESRKSGGSEYLISFNRSDISSYRRVFEKKDAPWFLTLLNDTRISLSPLNRMVLGMLEGYNEKDAILDGVLSVRFDSEIGFREILDIAFAGNISRIRFRMDISMLVTDRSTEPAVFEGTLTGQGDRATRTITLITDSMTYNGRTIRIKPMVFKL